MSFDFDEKDLTSDFVSKFPSLDGDDADAALHQVATSSTSAHNTTDTGFGSGDFGNDDEDLLGGGVSRSATTADAIQKQTPKDERQQFDSQFPELDDPDLNTTIDVQPTSSNGFDSFGGDGGVSSTSSVGIAHQQQLSYSTSASAAAAPSVLTPHTSDPYHRDASDDEEPEPLRQWRHSQAESIARRSATAEREKAETISKAERDIDEFYAEYNAKKEKNIKKNKENEAAFYEKRQRELAEGTTWDRITKLIGLQNSQSKTIAPVTLGSTDLSRYREILLSLRREGETAPAAAGY